MTDSTGVFQHAIFSVPNFSEGYCTDDNARAFILAVLMGELADDAELERSLASTCAAFLHHAFDAASGRFHNHMSFDRRWLDEQGSEDSHGRALWALGRRRGTVAAAQFSDDGRPAFRAGFTRIDRVQLAARVGLRSAGYPRISAAIERRQPGNQARDMLTARLMELYDRHAHADWHWFEEELSYDNARLSHALIVSGRATGQEAVLQRGLETLRWLTEQQTTEKGSPAPDRQQWLLSPGRHTGQLRPAAHRGPGHRRGLPGSLSGDRGSALVRAGATRL